MPSFFKAGKLKELENSLLEVTKLKSILHDKLQATESKLNQAKHDLEEKDKHAEKLMIDINEQATSTIEQLRAEVGELQEAKKIHIEENQRMTNRVNELEELRKASDELHASTVTDIIPEADGISDEMFQELREENGDLRKRLDEFENGDLRKRLEAFENRLNISESADISDRLSPRSIGSTCSMLNDRPSTSLIFNEGFEVGQMYEPLTPPMLSPPSNTAALANSGSTFLKAEVALLRKQLGIKKDRKSVV